MKVLFLDFIDDRQEVHNVPLPLMPSYIVVDPPPRPQLRLATLDDALEAPREYRREFLRNRLPDGTPVYVRRPCP